jgi:protein tyrosine phosphatase
MAPTQKIIGQFWQMIWENNVALVVMLCCFKVNNKV